MSALLRKCVAVRTAWIVLLVYVCKHLETRCVLVRARLARGGSSAQLNTRVLATAAQNAEQTYAHSRCDPPLSWSPHLRSSVQYLAAISSDPGAARLNRAATAYHPADAPDKCMPTGALVRPAPPIHTIHNRQPLGTSARSSSAHGGDTQDTRRPGPASSLPFSAVPRTSPDRHPPDIRGSGYSQSYAAPVLGCQPMNPCMTRQTAPLIGTLSQAQRMTVHSLKAMAKRMPVAAPRLRQNRRRWV